MSDHFKIAIVGSGPGGLSAAARAAERDVSHVLLETEDHLSNTIYMYQKGKFVMDETGHPAAARLRYRSRRARARTILGSLGRVGEEAEDQRALPARSQRDQARPPTASTSVARTARRSRRISSSWASACRATSASWARRARICRFVQYQLDDPGRVRGRNHRRGRRRRRRDRECRRPVEAEQRHHHQPQGRIRARQEGQRTGDPEGDRRRRIECYYSSTRDRVDALDVRSQGRPDDTEHGKRQGADPARSRHRPPRRHRATRIRRILRRGIPEQGSRGSPGDQLAIRIEREGAVHRRRARRLPADQAGDEPGLRGRRIHPRRKGRTGRRTPAQGRSSRRCPVSAASTRRWHAIQKNVRLLAHITTLQLREFMLDSDIRTPKPGETIFAAQRLHQHVFLDRRRRGPGCRRRGEQTSASP